MKATLKASLVATLLLLASYSTAIAETELKTISGQVVHMSGHSITTGEFFEYYAIDQNGFTVLLPEMLDGRHLLNRGLEVRVRGEIEPIFCNDMSPACPDAEFISVVSIDVFSANKPLLDTFFGKLKPFYGLYGDPEQDPDYVLEAGDAYIVLPDFVNSKSLYENDAKLFVEGLSTELMCGFESICPNSKISEVSSLAIKL
jgi:hypothetical protein